jgi:hypothetical protein
MKEFRIRCSSLSSIMADPQAYPRDEMSQDELEALKITSAKRTDAQAKMLDEVMARSLSEGAKTHVHNLVRRHIYDYEEPELKGKEIQKGNAMEGSAINLLSSATGDILSKNDRLFSDGILCGTPDTWDGSKLYDTKVPFTIESWPMVGSIAVKMARAAGYEWQGRGYTMLMNEAGVPHRMPSLNKRSFLDRMSPVALESRLIALPSIALPFWISLPFSSGSS